MLAQITGWPILTTVLIGAAFSALYVALSGFRAVVRTDVLQLVLMYGGFLILLPAALAHTGGFDGLWGALPASHHSWDGGLGWQTVLVWYLIALQTVVEPSFYQRVFAARSPRIARARGRGFGRDVGRFRFLHRLFGTRGAVAAAGPHRSDGCLPRPRRDSCCRRGLAAFFTVALFATVMSTLDSYLFIAATTIGHDFSSTPADPQRVRRRTRFGLFISAGLAALGALVFSSAVQVWHDIGSVVTSTLLLPVLAIHLPPPWRPSEWGAVLAMIAAAATACAWILLRGSDGYPLGVEPMFPALLAAGLCLVADRIRQPSREPLTLGSWL